MKKMKNLWLVMLAIALAFGMAACGEEDGEEEEEPIEEFTGTYTADYKLGSGPQAQDVTETVVIKLKSFRIFDTTSSFLDFSIDKWEIVETPAAYKDDYPNAFKFTGKITAADPQKPANP
ncbi:MAG: hypothetical protein LBI04_11875, partial [Treponema sp.]|nr:hypothetical protein [Treponema sp.]